MFVHLTPEKNIGAIRRSGIKTSDTYRKIGKGVFAMPVTPNFYISHQWLRELKYEGQRTIVGVYFRISDDEVVSIGHYNKSHLQVTASEALAIIFEADEKEGYEVIIPRKIQAGEIHKIKHLPQVIGWRYSPNSHDWFCGCRVCVPKGSIRGKIKRDKWESQN